MGYTISFFINGYGQQPNSISNVNTIPELPILEEDGFIFEGWYLEEDLINKAEAGIELTSDITLYACWTRTRGYTNANTYVDILGPDIGPEIDITPSEPGLGGDGNESTTGDYYEGNSFYKDTLPNLSDTLFMDVVTYNGRSVQTELLNYKIKGSTVVVPQKVTSEDSWVTTANADLYYNNNSTKTQLSYIVSGTKPTFKNKIYELYDQSESYGTYIRVDIYRKSTGLEFHRVNINTGATLDTVTWAASKNLVDGSIPKKVILVLQAAGGGGSNAYKSGLNYSGSGGASGGLGAVVINLNSGLQNSFPNYAAARVYIPTMTAANTDGNSIYVEYPTSYNGNGFTYAKLIEIEGGNCNSGSQNSTGGWGTSYTTVNYEGDSYNYWWRLQKRHQYESYELGYTFYSVGSGSGGSGATGSPGHDSTAGYFYSSKVRTGGASETTMTSNLYTNEYLKVGGFTGGTSDGNVGGGAASFFANGGNGATSSSSAGGNGSKGSGGGGGKKSGGTGGKGGGGLLQVWY